jgi:hypothetical protein
MFTRKIHLYKVEHRYHHSVAGYVNGPSSYWTALKPKLDRVYVIEEKDVTILRGWVWFLIGVATAIVACSVV